MLKLSCCLYYYEKKHTLYLKKTFHDVFFCNFTAYVKQSLVLSVTAVVQTEAT